MTSSTTTPAAAAGRRAAARPPRRLRHRATIWASAGSAAVSLFCALIAPAPSASISLGPVGLEFFASPWFLLPFVLASMVLAVATWLPPFTPATIDWQVAKRSRALREFTEDDDLVLDLAGGKLTQREKTLAEVGLEGALREAEAVNESLRAELRRAHAHPAARVTVDPPSVDLDHLRAQVQFCPPADQPAVRRFLAAHLSPSPAEREHIS